MKMPQSWEQHVAGQEEAEWGNFLNTLIGDLAYLSQFPKFAGLAEPLRRTLEKEFEGNGGKVDFAGDEVQARDHLLHVHDHDWSKKDVEGILALNVVHDSFHNEETMIP